MLVACFVRKNVTVEFSLERQMSLSVLKITLLQKVTPHFKILDPRLVIKEVISCRSTLTINALSLSQIVALFMSFPVGCRCFGKRLSPHFKVMSPVGKTPWRASLKTISHA